LDCALLLINVLKHHNNILFQAEEKYADLADEDNHIGWKYFKHFKMALHGQKVEISPSSKRICHEIISHRIFSAFYDSV
jgi:hypothetical protein